MYSPWGRKAVSMEIIKKHPVRWAAVILEWLIFFLFTALVMFVDVRPIGPEASSVGFASLNQWVAKAFPYRPFFHKISDYLGYLAILLDGTFALIALSQWISRRKLWAVDHNLLFLMFFYTVVVINIFLRLYVLNLIAQLSCTYFFPFIN